MNNDKIVVPPSTYPLLSYPQTRSNLITAHEVNENQDNENIQVALIVDDDAVPKSTPLNGDVEQRRKKWMMVAVGVLIILLTTAGIAGGTLSAASRATLCEGEILSRQAIGWSLRPHGYYHSSNLPTIVTSPRPYCATVLPTWANGLSVDSPNNYFLVNTAGNYSLTFWARWNGLTTPVLDHYAVLGCSPGNDASVNHGKIA
jgi:hypothetical protein